MFPRIVVLTFVILLLLEIKLSNQYIFRHVTSNADGVTEAELRKRISECESKKKEIEAANYKLSEKLQKKIEDKDTIWYEYYLEAESKYKQLQNEKIKITPSPQKILGATVTQANTQNLQAELIENGKKYLIRDLIIGSFLAEEIRPVNEPFKFRIIFKPHQILELKDVPEERIKWFVKVDCTAQKSIVTYDKPTSTGEQEREVKNNEETWGWNISPPNNFKMDTLYPIVKVRYEVVNESPGEGDISLDKIVFVQEPGWVTEAIKTAKDNLNYILGVISTMLTIMFVRVQIKLGKTEIKLNETEIKLNEVELKLKPEEGKHPEIVTSPVKDNPTS